MSGDPKQIARRWFASTEGLASGLSIIEHYATDPPIAIRTLLDAIAGENAPPERICELGFGSGWLLEAVRERLPDAAILGLDMSVPMVREAAPRFPDVRLAIGDMEALPLADASFDAVATCWTLYFMRDLDAALEEIRRVIRPAGRLVAATVAPDHMHEMDEMAAEAMRRFLGREPQPDIGGRFDLSNGRAPLERCFEHVELREWRGEMRLPDAGTFVRYWASFGDARSLPSAERDAMAAALFDIAQERIDRDGYVHITRHDGAFVAHRSP